MKVAIFIPCFIDQFFPQTAWNMIKVLEKAGCEVSYNPSQTCCGQPACNAGFWSESKGVAAKFRKEFEGDNYIVCPSGSCVGFIRNKYDELLALEPKSWEKVIPIKERIYELSEFLIDILKVDDFGAKLEGVATYHDACGALRECGIKNAPRQLLAIVEGLTLEEVEDSEVCCGFGGTFAVKFEAISVAMAQQKINTVFNYTKAKYLISTDLSCLMHLDGYIKKQRKENELKVMHLADVLATGL